MPNYDGAATYPFRCRFSELKKEFDTWRPHYKEIQELVAPRKGRYLMDDKEKVNDGTKKHNKIINSRGIKAVKTIAAGLQGGLTSPSRPWFVLSTPDKEMMNYEPVRKWLHNVRQMMLAIYSQSNFYGSVYNLYRELAAFGVSAMLIEEDFSTVIRTRPFTIGEFYLSTDHTQRPDTLYRLLSLTARQMIQKFGKDKVSDAVLTAFNQHALETRFDIVHCIMPNNPEEYGDMTLKGNYMNKPFLDVYFEYAASPDKFLRVGGFNQLPFVSPRWDVNGVDVYGEAPGMDALGDIKMLQRMEEKKLKGLDKMIDPPMNAPIEMKGKGGSIISGDINFYSQQQGIPGFVPVHNVALDFNNLAFELDRVERRIDADFYNDLFLAITSLEGTSRTATEIAKRYEEKLIMLGPVLERLQSEFLDPCIDRTFAIMESMGILPEPPQELQGVALKVEYVSMLAQAQKMVGLTSIEQTAAFVGSLSAVIPEVIDKFDADEAIDQYADLVGIPPSIIRPDDKVNGIREARAQKQQLVEQQANAAQVAENAKVLSQAKVGENNALEALIGAQR